MASRAGRSVRASAVVACVALVAGVGAGFAYQDVLARLMFTGALTAFAWGVGVSAHALDRLVAPPLGLAGAATTTIAAVLGVLLAWQDPIGVPPEARPGLLAALWITVPMSLLAADAGVLLGMRLVGGFARGLRLATLAVTALVTISLFAMPSLLGAAAGRAATGPIATGLLAVAGLHLAMLVTARADARTEQRREARRPDRATVTLQCPRCSLWVRMHAGLILCPGCRLKLRIEFEEPRCGCGYPLHQLAGPSCPECGVEVPPEGRWGAARGASAVPPAPTGG